MEKILLKINGKDFTAEFDRNEKSTIFINGKPMKIELMKKYSPNLFSFTVNQRLVQIELNLKETGPSFIALDGFSHEIEITDETRKLLKQYILSSGADDALSAGILKAPMPGLVVKILAPLGTVVNKGDKIIIIEAMKMENSLASPVSGIVKSIKVKEGQPVDKNTVLMEVEPAVN